MLIDTVRGERRRWLTTAAGFGLGFVLLASPGLHGALAQNDGITVGGGSAGAATSAADIAAMVDSILADVFGDASVADDGAGTGGDFNVGGNMGGSVTMGGGGDISIGGGSSGSISVE